MATQPQKPAAPGTKPGLSASAPAGRGGDPAREVGRPGRQTGGPGRQTGRRPRRKSRYGVQLQEKQDLKQMFGIREEQLKRYYKEARRHTGQTGPEIVVLLERRLDNAIYRAGFAQTRPQARQMATHRLFTVNGRPVDIPSHLLRPGDIVMVRPSKKKASYFTNFEKRLQNMRPPSWITLAPKEYAFRVETLPTYEEANVGVDMRSIVEYFAR